MNIGIHHNPNIFSEQWIGYCKKNIIDYKIFYAFYNNIVGLLKRCYLFMWHHQAGFKTCWNFDEKIAQKYLLEVINAPLVPSYIFYDKQPSLDFKKKCRCIEVNLFGKTIRFSQYAGEPFFKDITDQVINNLLSKIEGNN